MVEPGTSGASIRRVVYLNRQGARVGLDGTTLTVETTDDRNRLRLDEISELVVIGNVHITAPALRESMRRGIPVNWLTLSGWFLGTTTGLGHGDGALRAAQHAAVADTERRLAFARPQIGAKLRNCRTLLRRNGRGREATHAVRRLANLSAQADRADDIDRLRGLEGAAAAIYFKAFTAMLRGRARWASECFRGRNRRPPADPINAALSFAYSVQTRAWSAALSSAGLDVYAGFLHGFRHGRPALALDLMEPTRPRIAESAVLRALNTGVLRAEHIAEEGGAVLLGEHGRHAVLGALEDRLDQTARHDELGRDIACRDIPSIEAARLARALRSGGSPPIPPLWR